MPYAIESKLTSRDSPEKGESLINGPSVWKAGSNFIIFCAFLCYFFGVWLWFACHMPKNAWQMVGGDCGFFGLAEGKDLFHPVEAENCT